MQRQIFAKKIPTYLLNKKKIDAKNRKALILKNYRELLPRPVEPRGSIKNYRNA